MSFIYKKRFYLFFATSILILFYFACSSERGFKSKSSKNPVGLVDDKTGTIRLGSKATNKLLYVAAKKNGFVFEKGLEVLVQEYREALWGGAFWEQYQSTRISVSMDEIRDQYIANREGFKRTVEEVRLLSFFVKDSVLATSIKIGLLQYDPDIRVSIIKEQGVSPTTVSQGDLPIELDAVLFFNGGPPRGVLGPIKTRFGFHVLEVLEFFPSGSFQGLDEVYDEVSQEIYRTKKAVLFTKLLDSLVLAYKEVGFDTVIWEKPK